MRDRPVRRRVVVLLVAIGACSGGDGGPTDPPPPPPSSAPPSLRVVAGTAVDDTVHARSAQAVLAEVRDGSGKPMANVVVRFEPSPPSVVERPAERTVYLCAANAAACGPGPAQLPSSQPIASTDTTDANGRALADLRLGTIAGTATVRVSVPALDLATTFEVTVRPGNAVRVDLAGDDTTVVVGTTLIVAPRVVDRYANARTDVPRLTSSAPEVRVTGSTVTADDISDGWLYARLDTLVDSLRVRAVPAGRLVVWEPQGGFVYLVSMDGTATRELLRGIGSDLGAFPRFSASGTRVAVHGGPLGSRTASVSVVRVDTMGGTRAELGPPGLTQVTQVRELADGLLYFVARPTWTADEQMPLASLWRATDDGAVTAVAEIPDYVAASDYAESAAETYGGADLSPDGSQLAYVGRSVSPEVAPPLRVLDVATGVATTIAATAQSPRWSPAGDRLAYLVPPDDGVDYGVGGRLVVSAADGSDARVVGTDVLSPGLAWSPDGRYLLGRSATEHALRLIRPEDGREIVLRFGVTIGVDSPVYVVRDYFQPDWR